MLGNEPIIVARRKRLNFNQIDIIEVDYQKLLSYLENKKCKNFFHFYTEISKWLRNNNFNSNNWHTLYIIKILSKLDENNKYHFLYQQYNCGLNELAEMDFTTEEWCQFAQLIGYSLSGYSELNYVDNAKYNEAIAASKNQDPRDSKIAYLEGELKALRKGLKEPIARLFEKYPDDFKE